MDKFNIHEWKRKQLLSEGRGEDMADKIISQLREKVFKTLDDDELDAFKKRLLQAILLDSEYKKLYEGFNINEEDDRCTRIAKRKYDVWPSAYASGAVVRCRKGEIWKDEK